MSEYELHIKRAIDLSISATQHGNHPFGALLVDKSGAVILEAENTVNTESDVTRHAELNLVSAANKKFSPEKLKECTLYTSTEPCCMCAGAIFWTGIKHVVYSCPEGRLSEIVNRKRPKHQDGGLNVPCRVVYNMATGVKVQVTGPILEEMSAKVHEDYW
ncbi:ASNAP2 [Acrasis kona]|uniref:ASNAP2 n=1 Tax=Acrasis kona TaxID=1008807 RepID=A0AAW2YLQ6_9EUKA